MTQPLSATGSVPGLDEVEKILRAYGVARENYEWVMREGRPLPGFAYDAMRKAHAALVSAVRVAFAEPRGADVDDALNRVLEGWDESRTMDEGEMRFALRFVLERISAPFP